MDIKQVISNRSAIKLLIVAAVSSASLVLASESCDPHQRAREMIAPPFAYETVSQHTAEAPAHLDPHQQASDMMHDEHWPATSMPQPVNDQGQGGVEIDPHRHARSMIVGHPD